LHIKENVEMRKFIWTLGWLSLSAASFLSPSWAAAQAAKQNTSAKAPITISLIAFNDFHGNILPPGGSVLVPDPDNPAGARVSAGGAAYLSTLIKNLKQFNP
jgi:2',3'-cyclic-nucleotide 2'-phosphodiesterase (5'-nucleotidase family)